MTREEIDKRLREILSKCEELESEFDELMDEIAVKEKGDSINPSSDFDVQGS